MHTNIHWHDRPFLLTMLQNQSKAVTIRLWFSSHFSDSSFQKFSPRRCFDTCQWKTLCKLKVSNSCLVSAQRRRVILGASWKREEDPSSPTNPTYVSDCEVIAFLLHNLGAPCRLGSWPSAQSTICLCPVAVTPLVTLSETHGSVCFSRALIPGTEDRYIDGISSVTSWPKGKTIAMTKPLLMSSLFPARRAAIFCRRRHR